MSPQDTAHAYIRKIRNNGKQQYAYAYLMCLLHPDKFSILPDAKVFGLGTMGAQAVRMRLSEILTQCGEFSANQQAR